MKKRLYVALSISVLLASVVFSALFLPSMLFRASANADGDTFLDARSGVINLRPQ